MIITCPFFDSINNQYFTTMEKEKPLLNKMKVPESHVVIQDLTPNI